MAGVVDIAFGVSGGHIAADYAYSLYRAVIDVLPWLEDEVSAGIHGLQGGTPTDRGTVIVGHRTKLVIRIPEARVSDAGALTDRRLKLADGFIDVRTPKTRALVPFAHINAHFVATGAAEENEFLEQVTGELEKLAIPPQFICGRSQSLTAGDRKIRGFSLMLYGMKPDQSIRLMETGLGQHRKLGCGIFLPHKSIVAFGARDRDF